MKCLKFAPLLAVPLLLGATCVTRVEQKGPTGPWVGEVVNTGTKLEPDVHVYGGVLDSSGKWFDNAYAEICPFDLLPGQKGYFIKNTKPLETHPDAALPLRLTRLDSYACQRHRLTTDIDLRVVSKSEDRKSALVEARNNSRNTYYDLNVCALSFAASGGIQDIAMNSELPVAILNPGDKVAFPLDFTEPINGSIEFAVESAFGTYDSVLDSSHFQVSASRVVETEQGRELQVVGEILNDSTADLTGGRYEVYLESAPDVRASGGAASLGTLQPTSDFGTGFIPAGQAAPVVFSLPLDRNYSTRIKLAGVVATASSERVSPVPVTNIFIRREAPDVVYVTATISNPFSVSSMMPFICFELRGADSQLVGASCMSSCSFPANASYTASRTVHEIAPMETVDVIAYGRPGTCPITPPSDPGPPPCDPPD